MAKLVYDHQGFAVAEDGTRLFYGVLGSGPLVVLNDGIGCDGFAWKYIQPEFARDHTVVHWHYRGHGRSGLPRDRARLDIPAIARDLTAVLAKVDKDLDVNGGAILMGHSMGTQVCLEYDRLFRHRARAHVLLCGSYGKVTETFHGSDMLKQVLPTLIEQVQRRRGLARALWGRVSPAVAFRVASMSGEIDALNIQQEDFETYWEHINLMDPDIFLPMLRGAGEHSAEDFLTSIDVPALVIAAERDTFTPSELAQSMADRIPGGEFTLLEGASHAAPIEHPDTIIARIREFLATRL
ncbi:MAG: alpha/beta hydrolase [Deltaproteobacteria bacterium]|nr:alpha/beta hydrolase [Deltaproteobacteria bacterium]